jgi:hypothetical protein
VRACYAALRMQETVKLTPKPLLKRGRLHPRSVWGSIPGKCSSFDRQRSADGLHRRRPNDALGRADGADSDTRLNPCRLRTRNLVEGYFQFPPIGTAGVKGLDAPTPAFELVCAIPSVASAGGPPPAA